MLNRKGFFVKIKYKNNKFEYLRDCYRDENEIVNVLQFSRMRSKTVRAPFGMRDSDILLFKTSLLPCHNPPPHTMKVKWEIVFREFHHRTAINHRHADILPLKEFPVASNNNNISINKPPSQWHSLPALINV